MKNHFRGIKWRTGILSLALITSPLYADAAQGQLSIKKQSASLKQIIQLIEKESGYTFFFRSSDIDDSKKVNIDCEGSIEEVLKIALKESGMTYVIKDKEIILKPVPVTQNAQQKKRIIKGSVIDAETKEPIIGANVWVKETTIGAVTDVNGNYSLSVNANVGLVVASYLGYKDMEVMAGDKTEIQFKLVPDAEALEEVMVIAYGSQKKESVIGAISSVDIAKLKVPTSNISNNLAGQLAGIVAVTRSGEPGSGSEFYIRGISTFGANKNPLVLVDGIERSLDLVDPEDIASFSILKDATATAVYGVRGANGVILISTRKGADGAPRINVKAEMGILGPSKMPKMANSAQFAEMYNEASGSKYYSQEVIDKYANGTDPDLYPDVNWIDELYQDFTSNQRVNVNISGGGSIAKYYIAGSIYNEGSIFKSDNSNDYNSSINYNKINFRANLDLNLSKSTTLNLNLANVYEKKNSPGAAIGDIWSYSFATSPNAFPARYSDGKFSGPLAGSGFNPYNLLMQSGYREQFWNSAQSLIGLTQDFSEIVTQGLKANIKFSWDAYNSNLITRSKEVQQFMAIGRDEDGNIIYNETAKGQESLGYKNEVDGYKTTYLEGSITYDRLFNDVHRVGALFLYNHKIKNYTATGDAQTSLPYKNQGIAGRITYSYNDRYFIEGNIGYNGSENFSPSKRFGVFPAGALGWMVSNEKFFQPITSVIDVLKIKGSYGIVGNDQIGGSRRFIYEATIKQSDVPGYQFGETGNYNPGAIRIGEWANANVGWEQAYKTNIGLELSLFRKLKLQGDVFHEKREGIFMQRAALPGLVGLSTTPWVNVGKMKNQGFDGTVEYEQTIGDFVLTGRGNFTYSQSEILDNDEPDWKNLYQNRIGKPYGQLFGLEALGLFQSQEEIDNSPTQSFGAVRVGDIKYNDINGDGLINEEDVVAIGHSNIPKINYGFGGTLQWKGIDVSVFFQGISKVSYFLSGNSIYGFNSGSLTRAAINEDVYLNRWTENNPNAKYPRLDSNANTNNNRNSTFRMIDGSFLRFKNAEIGYTFPKKMLNGTFLKTVRVYASGVNLLTFSNFKLWDPEQGGGEGAGYPPSRIFNVGLNVNF